MRPMANGGSGPRSRRNVTLAMSALEFITDSSQTSRHFRKVPTTEVVNIHLASDTTDSSDYLRDRADDLACDYFKSRKRA